jgi:hypothetical protein
LLLGIKWLKKGRSDVCTPNREYTTGSVSSFPQPFERESAARKVANVCARYRSQIISTGLIKVGISPPRNFRDDRLDS